MFEQSMVVSQGTRVSAEARWTMAGSVTLQSCAAALMVALPLLHPERLAPRSPAPQAFVELKTSKPLLVKMQRTEAMSTATTLPSGPSATRAVTAPARIPQGISAGDPPPMGVTGGFRGMGSELPGELATIGGNGTRIAVVAGAPGAARGPMRVSSGVGAGMLVGAIRPVYPPIARAARVEGVVVVEAVISREGRIERARVVSGPTMLAGAALAAVEGARYTPYRLNGAALEVQTTITVNFKLGG